MSALILYTKQNISLHLKNLPEDREPDEDSVVKESLTGQTEGELHPDSVVNQWLTTTADGKRYRTSIAIFGLSREATVKQSLTVRTRNVVQATTEESLVVPVRGRYQGSCVTTPTTHLSQ